MSALAPFANRSAIIFGASEGTGLAAAQALGPQVSGVALISRSTDKLARAVRQVTSAKVHTVAADITSSADTQKAFDACVAALGPAGIVVNCAGAAHPGYFEDLTLD